ncbi:transcription-repair coupling factor [Patescibacteria group bacterium]|nr:transcription-repair coupling factor [Patescibacteria group bacterium]
MEQRQAPPDISEDVKRIAEKLNSKQKIVVKIPTNPVIHAFLLEKIIDHSDKIKSRILFLVDDEFAKLNLITHLKTKNSHNRLIILTKQEALDRPPVQNNCNTPIKYIIFEPFPSSPDVEINFTRANIHQLTKLFASKDEQKQKYKLTSFIKNLQTGDYVVHIDHGIAKFDGMVEQKIDNISREYFKLCYAENDALFLPVTSAEKMEKYIGDPNPTLNRLSSSGWGKSLSKVSIETLHHARELLNTQAKRQLSKAIAIPRAEKIEQDLAKSFPYTETDDQKKVIETICDDLSDEIPMDRLVCGDVGFGKTEIAIRAAAKVALEGFQVAVLSPTTILTQQHIDTFTDRLKNLPINIAALSRFQSKQEQLKTIDQIKKGKIDIIIGTHRLLSEDVKFKNLGLIVIDEEQRFGVNHKEQLKRLRSESHVLTLTATPIPRTLHLAVSGVRAISTISTPPGGRKPINTIIESYNQKHIAQAIQGEIKRKGQVYYLYNKVETMHLKKQELQDLLPKIKIGMLHGQMPEQEMAKQMHDFDKQKIDVLVCSTIIENGVDLPNVNTLIVDNAVQFGLSQLHQIRGRIGRGSRQAYAYFFFRRQKLTGGAEKRLRALEAAKELGAGFDIAQADMEIRGVGNVLGKAQHGHVKSIGLGLYLRLLNNAVEEIKSGAPSEMLSDISVDLPIEARIPKFFEKDKQKRIELYHEWALIDSIDEITRAKNELQKDGALPKPIENLFYIFSLKILGKQAGISAIDTAFTSSASQEQYIILQTLKPIEPRIFAKILDKCPHWQYGTEKIKVPKKDLGSDWMKKLEICVKQL